MADDDDRRQRRSVYDYENMRRIGKGTYGSVFEAKDVDSGHIVAIKVANDKRCVRALSKEIHHLSLLHHPRVIKLHEVVAGFEPNSFALVMELADSNLKEYMKSIPRNIPEREVRRLMYMILEGLEYLHGNGFIHRDIKTTNILLAHDKSIKIADFGSCRKLENPSSKLRYRRHIGTPCFRAAELALPLKEYTTAIDIWAAGCVMANLLNKKLLFDAGDEKDLLMQMFERIWMGDERALPGLNKFLDGKALLEEVEKKPWHLLRERFPELSGKGLDLLLRLLEYDPEKRISAEDALEHFWFYDDDI